MPSRNQYESTSISCAFWMVEAYGLLGRLSHLALVHAAYAKDGD